MNKNEYEERIKELEDQVKVIQERYRILVESTDALLFEYRPKDDLMIFIYNFPNNKSRREVPHYHDSVKISPMVHPEHLQKFMDVLEKASRCPTRGELQYLSKVSTGEFQWHKTIYSSIADDEGNVLGVLGRIYNIHESETRKQDMIHRGETDCLTGLYNKETIAEKIAVWLKANPTREANLLMMDLDDFQAINNRYGHAVGDEVLRDVAHVLEECFPKPYIISRFGGDEFVVFVMDETTKQVEGRVDEMMRRLSEGRTERKHLLHCSVGIAARLSKRDGFEELFNRADNAMYIAKKDGKNRYVVYA